MSVWAKEDVPLIISRGRTTGTFTTATHTVHVHDKTVANGSDDKSFTQCTDAKEAYYASVDLDTEIDYYVRIDGDIKGSLNARDGLSNIGMGG